jgi:hypothetical protein
MSGGEWLCRLYRAMLRAYPVEFRTNYGAEMARVFRDSLKDAVRSGEAPGFVLRAGRDWVGTVIEERMSSVRIGGFKTLRIGLVLTIAIDLAILVFAIRPGAHQRVVGAMVAPFVLLSMYGLFTLVARPGRGVALGFAGGIVLTLWNTIGAFAVPGSPAHGIGVILMLMLMLLFITAGFRAARSSGDVTAGAMAGCWSGLVCALTTVTAGLLLLQIAIPDQSVSSWRDATNWSQVDYMTSITAPFLTGAGQRMLLGPTIGLVCGLIGGVVGRMKVAPVLEAAQ